MPFEGMLSPMHWLVVGVIALLVLGPERLPGAARDAAKCFRIVRDARKSFEDSVRDTTSPIEEQDSPPRS